MRIFTASLATETNTLAHHDKTRYDTPWQEPAWLGF